MENKFMDEGGAPLNLIDIVPGYPMCTFGREREETKGLVLNLKGFECRKDDIFVLAPIKSGTHWIWEICSMLINGNAQTIPKSKSKQMLEHEQPETLAAIPSPRILNSHLAFRFLPDHIFQKKCRIIHIVRNPKDVVVSLYNHDKGVKCYGYNGKWEHFLPLFLEDKLEYGSWSQYILDWERFMRDNQTTQCFIRRMKACIRTVCNKSESSRNFWISNPKKNLYKR